MTPAARRHIRVREYQRAAGMCEGTCGRMIADRAIKAWDVVENDDYGDDGREYLVLCRSCRTRRDAPQRIREGKLTKAARAAQVKMPWAPARRRRRKAVG